MTRKECLESAAACVLKDRASQYGGVEDNFRTIANFWSVYVGKKISTADVAAMMGLLKIARARSNPGHGDSWIDLAGYAACGAECAMPDRPRAEECADLGFKCGDKVEVNWHQDGTWYEATYVDSVFMNGTTYCGVNIKGHCHDTVPCNNVRKPSAEGCEELVQRMVDSNPAIYGAGTEDA